MSIVLEAVFIGVAGVVGIGVMGKVGSVVGIKLFGEFYRRFEKKKLKKKLSSAIDRLNYKDFYDCIYEIKIYDNKYYKRQYMKVKNIYKFSDIDVNYKNHFIRRFDTENALNEDLITNIVKREISLSLKNIDRLDL